VKDNNDGTFSLSEKTLQQEYNLEAKEPFAHQICPGIGSGFLVEHNNKQLIYTAGHVISAFEPITDCRVIFGFRLTESGPFLNKFPTYNVFKGTEIHLPMADLCKLLLLQSTRKQLMKTME
jgi:hypothetical protein